MKTLALRKSKYYINTGRFRHHNNCGSTHPSMAASKENKLPPSFSGFKSQKCVYESSYVGVSETDNDKRVSIGLTDGRKTAKNLVDSRKN